MEVDTISSSLWWLDWALLLFSKDSRYSWCKDRSVNKTRHSSRLRVLAPSRTIGKVQGLKALAGLQARHRVMSLMRSVKIKSWGVSDRTNLGWLLHIYLHMTMDLGLQEVQSQPSKRQSISFWCCSWLTCSRRIITQPPCSHLVGMTFWVREADHAAMLQPMNLAFQLQERVSIGNYNRETLFCSVSD